MVSNMAEEELPSAAKNLQAPLGLVREVKKLQRLPVVNFSAGGVATPADAALMMQLGADGVFVGSGIFKSDDPEKTAAAIVKAVTHYQDPMSLVEASAGLGEPMRGISTANFSEDQQLSVRGN